MRVFAFCHYFCDLKKNQSVKENDCTYYLANHTLLGSIKVRHCKNKVSSAHDGSVQVESSVRWSVCDYPVTMIISNNRKPPAAVHFQFALETIEG